MPDMKTCPKCGAELPDNAPRDICPKCLMQAGLQHSDQAEHSGAATTPQSGEFVPPTSASLASLFPQLEILELLGHGGMGAVYKARQKKLDRLVALKIIRPESAHDPAFAERFNREARTLARLNHPNIVGVHDFGEVALPESGSDGGTARTLYYFLMEYVEGTHLRQLIGSDQLQPEQALAIVPQICEALQFAHDEGIVHRDIKPENVLLDTRGRLKIADFGLAKLLSRSEQDYTLTGTHQVMGTLRYMAPEQMEGSHAVDHRADIYSLGVVFYEMLTGEVPAGHFEPPSRKVEVDVRLDEVVLRSLARDPQRRYQQASEVKTDVESISQSGAGSQAAELSASAPEPTESDAVVRFPEAARQVRRIATALFVVGLVEWILVPLISGATTVWIWNYGPADWKDELFVRGGQDLGDVGAAIVVPSFGLMIMSTLLILAALLMHRVRFYWLAVLGSILAMLVFPANLAGLPIGIWSLVTLSSREARDLFLARRGIAVNIASVLPAEKTSKEAPAAREPFAWTLFAAVLLANVLAHGLIAFTMAWTASSWPLLGLALAWFVLAAVAAYNEHKARANACLMALFLGLFVSFGLVGYGVVLAGSALPLLIVPLCLVAAILGGVFGEDIAEDDEADADDSDEEEEDHEREGDEQAKSLTTSLTSSAYAMGCFAALACWKLIAGQPPVVQTIFSGGAASLEPALWFTLAGPVVLLGVFGMLNLRWYPLAVTSSLLCLPLGLWLSQAIFQFGSFAVGLWALSVLLQPEMRAAFRMNRDDGGKKVEPEVPPIKLS